MVDAFIFIFDLLMECLGVAVFMCIVWYVIVAIASKGKEKK